MTRHATPLRVKPKTDAERVKEFAEHYRSMVKKHLEHCKLQKKFESDVAKFAGRYSDSQLEQFGLSKDVLSAISKARPRQRK